MPQCRPRKPLCALALFAAVLAAGCAEPPPAPEPPAAGADMPLDVHSFARPDEVAVTHLTLDLDVDFDTRRLTGRASLTIDNKTGAGELRLDTRDLDVRAVTLAGGAETRFELGAAPPEEEPYLGRELVIDVTPSTEVVHVDYATSPGAAALQWLDPAQTAAGRPYLYTQSQAVLARTWVPCQDTPAVRFTYDATVRVPPELMAVMSAENPTVKSADGVYEFRMPQPIPSYLLALAVGDLEFQPLGERAGVYSEPPVVERAAWEFADVEAMIAAVEELYGPYLWGRYDVLVLPPSFPFGGMENPRLTFATPTILAGDRSLVALIAHELAHSWSGNLVTNATWNDFWLNEGFTVYLERRVMEALEGEDYADMLALLGRQDLAAAMADLDPRDTWLHLSLAGRDPDEGMNDVAYEKGYLFLRTIEETVGRERFDTFLKAYFERYRFQSLTSADFVEHLQRELVADDADLAARLEVDAWVYGPGVPENAPEIHSAAFARVEAAAAAWEGGKPAAELATGDWTTHEWLHFLRTLPKGLSGDRMAELDAAFALTESGNSEILHAWLHHVIASRYEPGYGALEEFLTGMGRRKFLRPLYRRLAETEEGLAMAERIYARARDGYHAVATSTIDEILGWEG